MLSMERPGVILAIQDAAFKFPIITTMEYAMYALARKEGVDLPIFPFHVHYALITACGGIATVIQYTHELLKAGLQDED